MKSRRGQRAGLRLHYRINVKSCGWAPSSAAMGPAEVWSEQSSSFLKKRTKKLLRFQHMSPDRTATAT